MFNFFFRVWGLVRLGSSGKKRGFRRVEGLGFHQHLGASGAGFKFKDACLAEALEFKASASSLELQGLKFRVYDDL